MILNLLQFLKDAAATAIYGNRGANGVILITTKRGSAEKTNISVSVKTGTNMDYLPRYSTIESPERFTELVWESLKNRGQALIDSGSASAPASAVEYANTNIFGANGFDPGYNMWTTPGDQLIDPATGGSFPQSLENTTLKTGEIMLSKILREMKLTLA